MTEQTKDYTNVQLGEAINFYRVPSRTIGGRFPTGTGMTQKQLHHPKVPKVVMTHWKHPPWNCLHSYEITQSLLCAAPSCQRPLPQQLLAHFYAREESLPSFCSLGQWWEFLFASWTSWASPPPQRNFSKETALQQVSRCLLLPPITIIFIIFCNPHNKPPSIPLWQVVLTPLYKRSEAWMSQVKGFHICIVLKCLSLTLYYSRDPVNSQKMKATCSNPKLTFHPLLHASKIQPLTQKIRWITISFHNFPVKSKIARMKLCLMFSSRSFQKKRLKSWKGLHFHLSSGRTVFIKLAGRIF